MAAWKTYSIVAISLSVVLFLVQRYFPSGPRKPKVLGGVVVLSVLAQLSRMDWVRVIPVVSFFAFMVWEQFSPRTKYKFASQANLRDVTMNLLRPAFQLWFGASVLVLLKPYFPRPPWGLEAHGVIFIAQLLIYVAGRDFKEFGYHWLSHKSDLLWRLHRVHHNATELTVFSWSRADFIEVVIKQLLNAVFAGIIGCNPLVLVYGGAINNVYASQFTHSNIAFPKPGSKPFWARILITPLTHALHHTPEGMRSNYGGIFTFWDRMFGFYREPKEMPTVFGIDDQKFSELGFFAEQLSPLLPRSLIIADDREKPLNNAA